MSETNGDIKQNPIPELPHPQVMAEMVMSMNRSVLGERMQLASRAGKSFGGDRNLFHTLGYKEDLEYQDYLSMYKRGDIAQRIVEAPVDDTWRNPPELREGDGEDANSDTPFTRQFDEFAQKGRPVEPARTARRYHRYRPLWYPANRSTRWHKARPACQ